MSQAPGLFGIPDSGHRSSAATRASCARSSARPTSRTIRARPAMSLADSILQTASIARWVSEAVTAADGSWGFGGRGQRAPASAPEQRVEAPLAAALRGHVQEDEAEQDGGL